MTDPVVVYEAVDSRRYEAQVRQPRISTAWIPVNRFDNPVSANMWVDGMVRVHIRDRYRVVDRFPPTED